MLNGKASNKIYENNFIKLYSIDLGVAVGSLR